jgi:predicted dehydrogenase
MGKKPNLDSWGTESIEKKGSCMTEIDGKVVQGKIPTLQGNYYDFDEVYDSIANDKEEPVTGQDGLRVMQIIKLPFKVVLRKSNQFIDKVKLLGALYSNYQALA